MKTKNKIRKKGIEKLLDKGIAMPIPYSDCIIVCHEKEEKIKVYKRYELYQPTNDGRKFKRIKDIGCFQK